MSEEGPCCTSFITGILSCYYICYSSFMLVKFQLQLRESVLQGKEPLNVHLTSKEGANLHLFYVNVLVLNCNVEISVGF